jgi:hypothetical protein
MLLYDGILSRFVDASSTRNRREDLASRDVRTVSSHSCWFAARLIGRIVLDHV